MDIEVPLSPIADYILMPGRVHFIGGTDDSISTSAHLLSRSFNRFFFTCSLGLLAPPSSHESTLPTLTMCSSPALLRESSIVLLAQKSFPQKAPPKCGHGFDRGLVETLGGNANGVLDAFGVGEGDDAGADVWHRFIIGEGKTKNERG
jgi:hypothetical protein